MTALIPVIDLQTMDLVSPGPVCFARKGKGAWGLRCGRELWWDSVTPMEGRTWGRRHAWKGHFSPLASPNVEDKRKNWGLAGSSAKWNVVFLTVVFPTVFIEKKLRCKNWINEWKGTSLSNSSDRFGVGSITLNFPGVEGELPVSVFLSLW